MNVRLVRVGLVFAATTLRHLRRIEARHAVVFIAGQMYSTCKRRTTIVDVHGAMIRRHSQMLLLMVRVIMAVVVLVDREVIIVEHGEVLVVRVPPAMLVYVGWQYVTQVLLGQLIVAIVHQRCFSVRAVRVCLTSAVRATDGLAADQHDVFAAARRYNFLTVTRLSCMVASTTGADWTTLTVREAVTLCERRARHCDGIGVTHFLVRLIPLVHNVLLSFAVGRFRALRYLSQGRSIVQVASSPAGSLSTLRLLIGVLRGTSRWLRSAVRWRLVASRLRLGSMRGRNGSSQLRVRRVLTAIVNVSCGHGRALLMLQRAQGRWSSIIGLNVEAARVSLVNCVQPLIAVTRSDRAILTGVVSDGLLATSRRLGAELAPQTSVTHLSV